MIACTFLNVNICSLTNYTNLVPCHI